MRGEKNKIEKGNEIGGNRRKVTLKRRKKILHKRRKQAMKIERKKER